MLKKYLLTLFVLLFSLLVCTETNPKVDSTKNKKSGKGKK